MPSRNVRRHHNIAAEQYDPKQRIVGGIVLFLMMLLIYGILKIMLGISAPDKFAIDKALEFENFNIVNSENIVTNTINYQQKNLAIIPKKFVFLDLSGKSMQPEETMTSSIISGGDIYAHIRGEDRWYVQVASFKNRGRAERLVNKIKEKNIATEVHIISTGDWLAVRLPPESERSIVKQQKNKLRRILGVKPAIKKIK
ncbi:MAG TPA: SPOR domain-containing protein [Candidatus Moranbacteria bacterium]|nr:SPOR domain-containing protein [Candidatus Moranbacteria bacterium]